MIQLSVEYDIAGGDVTCVRFFDAAVVPPQQMQPGRNELILDPAMPQALRRFIKRNAGDLQIDHARQRVKLRLGRLLPPALLQDVPLNIMRTFFDGV